MSIEHLDSHARAPAASGEAAVHENHLVASTFAVVLAGGRGARLHQLTDRRAKPAMPFAGNLKIVDFALSNCINSGIRRVAVLTQYKAQSLIRHVTRGWGFLDASMGEFIDVVPAQQRVDTGWYSGTANAVFQNLDMLRMAAPRHVLVLAGDHVYKMDYSVMLAEHVARGAEVSVACLDVPLADARGFGVMRVDDTARITDFQEKPFAPTPMPGRPDRALASMGIYIFDAEVLYRELARDDAQAGSTHDFGADILPSLLGRCRVFAHDYSTSCVNMIGDRPYWRDVGTLDAFWEANQDLARPLPELNLYDDAWPIRGLPQQLPPAKFVFDDDGRRGIAIDSLVAGGCIVSGATVRRSVLFSRARVDDGSLVEDSLLLTGVRIGRDAIVRRAIIDKRCVIPDGLRIGVDDARDRARYRVTERGIVLVTQAMLADGTRC